MSVSANISELAFGELTLLSLRLLSSSSIQLKIYYFYLSFYRLFKNYLIFLNIKLCYIKNKETIIIYRFLQISKFLILNNFEDFFFQKRITCFNYQFSFFNIINVIFSYLFKDDVSQLKIKK